MSMKNETLPLADPTWLAHSPILAAGNGLLARCVVLHATDGYHPLVTHRASFSNGVWSYACGNYFFAKDLDKATADFCERTKTF